MLTLRASKIGGCPRAYVLDLRQGEPEITLRQKVYFAVGKALEPVIMMAAGLDPATLFNDKVEVKVDLGGDLFITGHPDSEDEDYIIECKTMRSFAYKRARQDGLEAQFPQYLVQGSIYCQGRGKKGVRYLCLDKDASTVEEYLITWPTLEKYFEKAVVTARTIQQWQFKTRLPGKPEDLPPWYCLTAYCSHTDCRHHETRRTKKPEFLKGRK